MVKAPRSSYKLEQIRVKIGEVRGDVVNLTMHNCTVVLSKFECCINKDCYDIKSSGSKLLLIMSYGIKGAIPVWHLEHKYPTPLLFLIFRFFLILAPAGQT